MNYANIKKYDIANGVGVRVSLFVSGCTHHCKNCFNQETWDFNYGKEFTEEVQNELLVALNKPQIKGLTLLGGEPFEKVNQRGLVGFLKKVRETLPEKDIWCYSGYVLDKDILNGRAHCEVTDEMLSYLDVLVDGPFVEALKDITLLFRGSSNQRLIDVKKTLKENQIVLLDI